MAVFPLAHPLPVALLPRSSDGYVPPHEEISAQATRFVHLSRASRQGRSNLALPGSVLSTNGPGRQPADHADLKLAMLWVRVPPGSSWCGRLLHLTLQRPFFLPK